MYMYFQLKYHCSLKDLILTPIITCPNIMDIIPWCKRQVITANNHQLKKFPNVDLPENLEISKKKKIIDQYT